MRVQCLDSDIAVHTSRTPLLSDLLSYWLSVSKATRRRWLIGAETQEGVFNVRSAFCSDLITPRNDRGGKR